MARVMRAMDFAQMQHGSILQGLPVAALLAGYALDLAIADPFFRFHPVRVMGDLIERGERFLNRGPWRTVKGALLVLFLCAGTGFLFYGADRFFQRLSWPADIATGFLFRTGFIFLFLANQGLIREGRAVFKALDQGIEEGRKRLARIVGRDTLELDAGRIRVAVFESMSENLSDGVVAPLFYFALAGVPGMAVYKMINTLDSMIGYRSDRFRDFGLVAARLDDVANFIPARITAVLLVLLSGRFGAFRTVLRYGSHHMSPNSGYPEAALAGILGCRFGGPNRYGGRLVHKPYIGDKDRPIASEEIETVAGLNHRVTFFCVLLIAVMQATDTIVRFKL